MSLKRISIMWAENKPETARVVPSWIPTLIYEMMLAFHHPWCRITTWNGLTSDKRDPIDIARQMDDFMRMRRLHR